MSTTRRSPPIPVELRSGSAPGELAAALRRAAGDSRTHPQVRRWLGRLLDEDAAEHATIEAARLSFAQVPLRRGRKRKRG